MSSTGKRLRLNRIFRTPGSRALIVACDHALQLGPIGGTEDPAPQAARFVEAGADAILMGIGTPRAALPSFLVPRPPALITRLDWTNVWHRPGAAQSGEPESMREVIRCCPTPVLLAGGPRQSTDEAALAMVSGAVESGAAGVIFGRNVFQAADMMGVLGRAPQLLAREPAEPQSRLV